MNNTNETASPDFINAGLYTTSVSFPLRSVHQHVRRRFRVDQLTSSQDLLELEKSPPLGN